MNRRRFLATTGSVAAVSLLGCTTTRGATCGNAPAGVQLFTVRDALQRDPRAAFAALRDIGIVEAELFGLNGAESVTLFGRPVTELKTALDAAGIRVPLSHIGGALTNTAAIAAIAKPLGIETLVVARPNEFATETGGRSAVAPIATRAALDALAAKLNRVGREYRDLDLGFAYHNHDIEFVPVDGVVPYDYLMANTDPALVKIELDLGWLAYSGRDPVDYLERYAGRVVACHLKDYAPNVVTDVPQRKLVPPGAGTVDFAAVLAAMRTTKVAHGFIEIDIADDPLAAVQSGHAHLEKIGCA
jgi:sugar phosphate isomerase/epimerase